MQLMPVVSYSIVLIFSSACARHFCSLSSHHSRCLRNRTVARQWSKSFAPPLQVDVRDHDERTTNSMAYSAKVTDRSFDNETYGRHSHRSGASHLSPAIALGSGTTLVHSGITRKLSQKAGIHLMLLIVWARPSASIHGQPTHWCPNPPIALRQSTAEPPALGKSGIDTSPCTTAVSGEPRLLSESD